MQQETTQEQQGGDAQDAPPVAVGTRPPHGHSVRRDHSTRKVPPDEQHRRLGPKGTVRKAKKITHPPLQLGRLFKDRRRFCLAPQLQPYQSFERRPRYCIGVQRKLAQGRPDVAGSGPSGAW